MQISENKLVKFSSDTKHRKQWFTGISFSHPAKMSLPLQLWLIDNYTKEGDVILDPMAGSGTILVACSLGRNVICVELEQKFVDMMKGNWEKIQQRGPQMGYEMGTCQIIQGDSRNLEGLLADKIISSPPYEAQEGAGIAKRGYQGSKHSPTDLVGKRSYMPDVHGQSEGQVGNLPYGSIDKIITSPPYEGSVSDDKEGPGVGADEGKYGRWAKGTAQKHSYTQDGEPSKVDAVVYSPPYEGAMDGGSRHTKGGIPQRDLKMKRLGSYDVEGKQNIGNLYGDTYLQAMLQVYQQCYTILKSGGLMILVVKNFIRNKQIVWLDLDTIKLCEQAGFTIQDRWYRELASQSFWRTIYYQKYPDVEPIKYEDILAFSKE